VGAAGGPAFGGGGTGASIATGGSGGAAGTDIPIAGTGGAGPSSGGTSPVSSGGAGPSGFGGQSATCTPSMPVAVPPRPSSDCLATVVIPDAVAGCPDVSACAITGAFRIQCPNGASRTFVVPAGAGRAAVAFSTNAAKNPARFALLGPRETPQVEEILPQGTRTFAMTGDPAGDVFVYPANTSTGVWRLRRTPDGWSQEGGAMPALAGARPFDARVLTLTKSFEMLSVVSGLSGFLSLASIDDDCWTNRIFQRGELVIVAWAFDLDGADRPWLAALAQTPSSQMELHLYAPDGTTDATLLSPMSDREFSDERLRVLGRGLDGQATIPSAVTQRADGIHVVSAKAGASVLPAIPGWTDTLVPGTAPNDVGNDCRDGERFGYATTACDGQTSCSTSVAGTVHGFDVGHTTTRGTYLASLEVNAAIHFSLTGDRQSLCGFEQLPACHCTRTETSRSGQATLVLTRVDAAGVPTSPSWRFPFAVNHPTPMIVGADTVTLTSRGDTLLALLSLGGESDTDLRYLEIDATMLK